MVVLNKETLTFILEEIPETNGLVSEHLFRKGQILFYEKHFPCGVFILLNGIIEVSCSGEILENVTAPLLIGLDNFFKNTSYSVTVKAISDIRFFFLSLITFKRLLAEKNTLGIWLKNMASCSRSI